MDPLNYFYASMRLAPIQCTTWGHSYTSGISTIDYYLSSKLYEVDELKNPQQYYSEKLILMDSLTTYYYNPISDIEILENLNITGIDFSKNLYYCLQSPFKISWEFDEILKNILIKDENGIILLSDINGVSLKRTLIPRFEKTIGKELLKRILFLPGLEKKQYISLISKCDVHIDTYPFGSCNSTIDSLMLGKPVITLPSEFLSGRFTFGFYKKMEMVDLVATTKEEYVDIAVKSANDKEWIKPKIDIIKEKSQSLLQDEASVEEYNIHLENLFKYYIENNKNMEK